MRDEQFREIDGVKYTCTMMPATKAHKVLIELVATIGRPALVAIATGFGSKIDSGIEEVVDVATALLTEKLTPDTSLHLLRTMLDGVAAEGVGSFAKDAVFDEHFRGKIMHLYRLVAWAISVNYSDFFAGARSNTSVRNALDLGTQALQVLTATMLSGVSAMQKPASTSETSSH